MLLCFMCLDRIMDFLNFYADYYNLLCTCVMMRQVTTNIIRPLPPNVNIYFDPDEDEPTLEPAWPHLSVGLFTY